MLRKKKKKAQNENLATEVNQTDRSGVHTLADNARTQRTMMRCGDDVDLRPFERCLLRMSGDLDNWWVLSICIY